MTRMPSFPPGENAPPDPPASSPGGETEHGAELAVATQGLADVVAQRVAHILVHGHTPEADAQRPLHFFAIEIEELARSIVEDSRFGLSLALMRRHAVKLTAFGLALVDRIDAHPPSEPTRAPADPAEHPRGRSRFARKRK